MRTGSAARAGVDPKAMASETESPIHAKHCQPQRVVD